jgi:hypothetical protein
MPAPCGVAGWARDWPFHGTLHPPTVLSLPLITAAAAPLHRPLPPPHSPVPRRRLTLPIEPAGAKSRERDGGGQEVVAWGSRRCRDRGRSDAGITDVPHEGDGGKNRHRKLYCPRPAHPPASSTTCGTVLALTSPARLSSGSYKPQSNSLGSTQPPWSPCRTASSRLGLVPASCSRSC